MLQYDFERIDCDAPGGYSVFGGVGLASTEHREFILRRAQDGRRYVGFVPAKQRAGGFLAEIDLVFEKETEN